MNDAKFIKVLDYVFQEKYLEEKELEYSKKYDFFLSPFEYKQFLAYKDSLVSSSNEHFIKFPLKTFNSEHIYFSLCKDLGATIESYLSLIIDDANDNEDYLSLRHESDFYKSRIYSEIEGTLNVESVPTTRRRLKELLEDKAEPINENDTIVVNMAKAIDYVESMPEFNKENLFKLYSILSNNCLSEQNKLKEGDYYRYDSVEVGKYLGCPHDKIEESMNSLFVFVHDVLLGNYKEHQKKLSTLLPHICHYYILYIHPYFDYNGRTARMVSYWIYLLLGEKYYLPIISEAINQTKNKYYHALEESRDANNDITYFLKYIYQTSINYALCYKNVELIVRHSKELGIILSETEQNYLKRIIISSTGKFSYVDFIKMCGVSMSKQGALKFLNKFVRCEALEAETVKSKSKLFKINDKVVVYKVDNY